MSWLGKLLGGTVGFMVGGPLGALIGVALGHNLDAASRGGGERLSAQERTQSAFFSATFSVMGHLAKADGRVSRDEIDMATRVMDEMQLPEEHRRMARELFRQGRAPDFPLDEVVEQLRRECHRSTNLAAMFLEILLHAAFADGEFDPRERALLERVCATLHLNRGELERLEAMVRAEHGFHGRAGAQSSRIGEREAYAVLGVDPAASNADLKRAYRRLMNQHHPDKLVAKGLPEEMMKLATDKTRDIKTAYDRVREARGL